MFYVGVFGLDELDSVEDPVVEVFIVPNQAKELFPLCLGHCVDCFAFSVVDPFANLHDGREGVVCSPLNYGEDVAYHKLDCVDDLVEVIVLVQFVARLVDVQDFLRILEVVCQVAVIVVLLVGLVCKVAVLFPMIHQESLLDEKPHLDIGVLHPQVVGVPQDVVKLVHIQLVYLVVDQLELPRSLCLLVDFPQDQGDHPLH